MLKEIKKKQPLEGKYFFLKQYLPDKRTAHYIVFVKQENLLSFKKITESKSVFNIKKYGTIIHSGFGDIPDKNVLSFLKSKYGFNFNE